MLARLGSESTAPKCLPLRVVKYQIELDSLRTFSSAASTIVGKAHHLEEGGICDLLLVSKVSTRFSLDRIMPRLGSHVVVIWVSDECIHETGEVERVRWGMDQAKPDL